MAETRTLVLGVKNHDDYDHRICRAVIVFCAFGSNEGR